MNDHVKQGQYYLEYLKFSCDPTCDECEGEGWTGGIPSTRSPLPALDPSLISPLDGGGQEVILTLIQGGGCNFILRPTLLILEPPPPLQIIIAQSLMAPEYERYLKIFSKLISRLLTLFALVQDILKWFNRLK